MEMMEKMNNLSFQVLEEIKELKDNRKINNLKNFDHKIQLVKSNYSSAINFYDSKNQLNVINETKGDLLYSTEKNRNSSTKKLVEIEKDNMGYNYQNKNPFKQYSEIDNKYDFSRSKNLNKINNNNKYIIDDNSRYNIRKQSTSQANTLNNFYPNNNENKNTSFYTNKFSNINNNFLNEIADDETMFSISNEIHLLRNNLNFDKNEYEDAAYSKIIEILPSFFRNEKLFSSFEIKDKTIKRILSNYDFGYFGIRCKDPLDSTGGKYYFNIYLQNTLKSNIFFGITSDARMGVPGGYHKSHNTFMYNLSNCDAFLRTNNSIGNFGRKGRSGDIYTFYVDFEFKFMKLFLNGNELNHNNIVLYSNETSFYPCLDMKDAEDTITFVDRIVLNFNN